MQVWRFLKKDYFVAITSSRFRCDGAKGRYLLLDESEQVKHSTTKSR